MNVENIMTPRVVTVDKHETLLAVRDLLDDKGIHHVLVTDNGRVLGVISDRDVHQTLSPFLNTFDEARRDVETAKLRAHAVMSTPVSKIRKEAPIAEAARRLLEHDISCLPVVSGDDSIVGIVTSRDILRYVANHDD